MTIFSLERCTSLPGGAFTPFTYSPHIPHIFFLSMQFSLEISLFACVLPVSCIFSVEDSLKIHSTSGWEYKIFRR